jgi:hypothetical protein
MGEWRVKFGKHCKTTILVWQLNPYLCNNGSYSRTHCLTTATMETVVKQCNDTVLLNNVWKVGKLVLSGSSCLLYDFVGILPNGVWNKHHLWCNLFSQRWFQQLSYNKVIITYTMEKNVTTGARGLSHGSIIITPHVEEIILHMSSLSEVYICVSKIKIYWILRDSTNTWRNTWSRSDASETTVTWLAKFIMRARHDKWHDSPHKWQRIQYKNSKPE